MPHLAFTEISISANIQFEQNIPTVNFIAPPKRRKQLKRWAKFA
jgi:hypothetical protein